ncbi:MAG: hypothetical protein GY940_28600, partial [bacterium]|nr:hypothetical protein [bacterium]
HTLFLNLGRILDRLEERDLKKIKQNYPLQSNSKKLLTIVKNNSSNFEERRTAALLLSGVLKKSNNLEQAIENSRNFLETKRDPLVEKMFKKDLNTYLDRMDKRQEVEQLFKSWVKLKRRKSYLSGENLVKFGGILAKMKLYGNAGEVFRHLLKYKLFSKHWETAWQQLARIDFHLGRYEKCLGDIGNLDIGKEPERSEYNYYKSIAYQRLKKENDLKTLLDSIQLNSIITIFQYRMANLKAAHLEKEKKFTDALELYQQMLLFKSGSKNDEGQLMVSIADLYYKVNDMESSLSYYRLAEQSGANLEWTLYRIASILDQLGKKPEAADALLKLKNVNPNSFWVKQLEKNVN